MDFPLHTAPDPAPIAAIQGVDNLAVQDLLRGFAEGLSGEARLAGVVERGTADRIKRKSSQLVSLSDGAVYPVFQDLGSGATGCALDPSGLIAASDAVSRDIAAGCDLVVLSKFGKLEAESGSGLVSAFATAIQAGKPILTSVSPRFTDAWSAFASPLFVLLPPEENAVWQWWSEIRHGSKT